MKKEDIIKLLKEKPYYLYTVDDKNKPQVRPFGSGVLINGMICICTNATKPVCKQMIQNPNIQISTTAQGYDWVRIDAIAKLVSSQISKGEELDIYRKAMFEDLPQLKALYEGNEHNMQVFELDSITIEKDGVRSELEG